MKNAKKEYNRAGYSVGIVFFLVYNKAKRKGSMHMELMYTSTRNASEKVTASQAILKGLSDDGGLFVPTEIPALDTIFFARFPSSS